MRSPGALWLVALGGAVGCRELPTYKTTVELTRVHALGDPGKPGAMDVEFRYSECPGDTRRLLRGDKKFAACGQNLRVGEKVQIDIKQTYDAERGVYRSDVIRVGSCDIKTDSKDDANYEMVENCQDVKTTGMVVGVRCSRRREPELVAKCPWLRR